MKKYIIGSRAIELLTYPYNILGRKYSDLDYLVEDISKFPKSNAKIQHYEIPPLWDYIKANKLQQVSGDMLYTLKVSHSFWDIHWAKTMFDIVAMKNSGFKLIEPLFNNLYSHWKKTHGLKNVNLNKKTEDFFADKVDREYVHDELHEFMSYYKDPMYKQLLLNPNKPAFDKSKFDALSFDDKLKTVREETYVIALERYLIPSNLKLSPKVAYKRAIKTIVTKISKGWFPKFIVENYKNLDTADIKYLEKFKNQIK